MYRHPYNDRLFLVKESRHSVLFRSVGRDGTIAIILPKWTNGAVSGEGKCAHVKK